MPRGLKCFKDSPLSKRISRQPKPERVPPYWRGKADRLLVEFVSRDGRRLYRTLEEVMLYPEERITFRHLEGPLHHASEEFRLSDVSEGTHITYQGQIECRTPFLPGVGWLVAFLYVRPKYGNVVKRHMGMLKKAVESPGAGDMMKEGK